MKRMRQRRRAAQFGKDTKGSVLVEATLVVPLVVLLMAGMMEWGVALYQYHLLSTATSEAVRQLIIARGTSTPYTYVNNAFNTWASTLGVTSGMVTVEVQDPAKADYNYKSCNTDSTCATALNTASGKPARVTVNYSCTMQFTPQFASPCPIRISMVGLVE